MFELAVDDVAAPPRAGAGDASEWAIPMQERPSAPPVEVPLSPQVQALVEAVAAVQAQTPADLPPEQALADTAALVEVSEQLRVAMLGRLADVDTRKLHDLDGAASTTSWMDRQQTSMTRNDVTLARRLSRLPGLSSAVQDKLFSVTVAHKIGGVLTKLRPLVDRPDGLIDGQDAEEALSGVIVDGVRDMICQALGGLEDDDPRLDKIQQRLTEVFGWPASEIARLEAAFVVLGSYVEPGLLPSALRKLVDALLPNELEKRAAKGAEDAGVTVVLKEDGSGWRVTEGDLDLECGELLHAVLTAEMAVDPDNPVDTEAWRALRAEGWEFGDEMPACGAPRSLRQRRHDALKNALRRLLDSGVLGTRDKVAPHILTMVGVERLHGEPGTLPARGASGASLPLSLVRSWWCDSAVSRFVMGLGRKVIEASHTERTLKPHERRAKWIETGGRCQGAGCCRGPGARLIPHHVDAWARCGSTSKDQTALLCEQTHMQVHQGKTIRLKDGRRLNQHGWVA